MLEVRHLLTAGHAPGGPEFQVHGALAVQAAEINRRAVDGLEGEARSLSADQRLARAKRQILSAGVGEGGRTQHA